MCAQVPFNREGCAFLDGHQRSLTTGCFLASHRDHRRISRMDWCAGCFRIGRASKELLLPAIEAPGSGQPFAPETHLVP